MKHRTPEISTEGLDAYRLQRKGVITKTYHVELLTPIYGGGVEPGQADPDLPIRAGALRGHLRMWWRIVQRARNPGWDSKKLFEEEAKIWGKAADNGDCGGMMEVAVNLDDNSIVKHVRYQDVRKISQQGQRPSYQAAVHPKLSKYGYALQGAKGRINKLTGNFEDEDNFPKSFILPPLKFSIDLTYHGNAFPHDVEDAVRWWAFFGGVGSRWRRGLGSVKVTGINHFNLTDPDFLNTTFKLAMPQDVVFTAAERAAERALKMLKDFRQGKNVGRKFSKGKPKRSWWPEANAIRDIVWREENSDRDAEWSTNGISYSDQNTCKHPIPEDEDEMPKSLDNLGASRWFPRAYFGMPLVFSFTVGTLSRSGQTTKEIDPEGATITPEGFERMASPLIVKAMALSNGTYAPIALCLPVDLSQLRLNVKYAKWRPARLRSGRNNKPDFKDMLLDHDVWDPVNHYGKIHPLKEAGGGFNPLDAFLHFFMTPEPGDRRASVED